MNPSHLHAESLSNGQAEGLETKKAPLSEVEQKVQEAASLLQEQESPQSSLKGRVIAPSDEPPLVSIGEEGILFEPQDESDPQGELVQEDEELEKQECTENPEEPKSETAVEAAPEQETIEEKPVIEEAKPEEPEKSVEASIEHEEEPIERSDDNEPVISSEEPVPQEISDRSTFEESHRAEVIRISLPPHAVDAKQLLADKIREHIDEKRSVEKENERENKTKEAVQAGRHKAELSKAAAERFIERLLKEKSELKQELRIEQWTSEQIKELARQTAEIFFEGHSSYYSYILSKELTEN